MELTKPESLSAHSNRNAYDSQTFFVNDDVYLADQYYAETNATVLEVPKYGWKIKSVVDGVATIEYQRVNWKLLMMIMCETKFLKREI